MSDPVAPPEGAGSAAPGILCPQSGGNAYAGHKMVRLVPRMTASFVVPITPTLDAIATTHRLTFDISTSSLSPIRVTSR